jgi:D-alanyl-D-alanine dipeptidase
MKHLDSVTAFADYKVPQMLRYFGAISYTIDLANKIDTKTLIKKDSREEIEIRAATIWCVEKMRQVNDAYTAAQLDNALWQISQNNIGILPYHRTKTIFY